MNQTIELPASELKTALTGLGKVISRRATLPVLEHLRVTRNAEGRVTLQATDLDTTATYTAEQPSAGSPCDFLVPYEPLNKLVKGSKEPVQLIMEGPDQVRLRTHVGSSPMEQAFTTIKTDEFPPTPVVPGAPILVNEQFRDALRQALECCSEDDSRHVLQHVCLDTRPKEGHYLAGTDGQHLFCANSFHFDLKEPMLIPDTAFLRWPKFLEDGRGELSVTAKVKDQAPWVQLRSGPWTCVCKSSEKEFPNWKQVVPAAGTARTVVLFDPSAVATLLAGVPRLPGTDDHNRTVWLEITENRFVVKARTKEATEWTRLTIEGVRVVGKAISIGVNRDYVLKALRFGLTTCELTDEWSPLVFSAGGRRLVVMPIRSTTEPAKPATPATPVSPASAVPSPEPINPQPIPNNPPVSESPQAQPKVATIMSKTPETKPTETTQAPVTETSPVKAVIQHIESIKETLKGVFKEFHEVLDGLKQIEKDKKASDKEIESVREKLREIQSVRI